MKLQLIVKKYIIYNLKSINGHQCSSLMHNSNFKKIKTVNLVNRPKKLIRTQRCTKNRESVPFTSLKVNIFHITILK